MVLAVRLVRTLSAVTGQFSIHFNAGLHLARQKKVEIKTVLDLVVCRIKYLGVFQLPLGGMLAHHRVIKAVR